MSDMRVQETTPFTKFIYIKSEIFTKRNKNDLRFHTHANGCDSALSEPFMMEEEPAAGSDPVYFQKYLSLDQFRSRPENTGTGSFRLIKSKLKPRLYF